MDDLEETGKDLEELAGRPLSQIPGQQLILLQLTDPKLITAVLDAEIRRRSAELVVTLAPLIQACSQEMGLTVSSADRSRIAIALSMAPQWHSGPLTRSEPLVDLTIQAALHLNIDLGDLESEIDYQTMETLFAAVLRRSGHLIERDGVQILSEHPSVDDTRGRIHDVLST